VKYENFVRTEHKNNKEMTLSLLFLFKFFFFAGEAESGSTGIRITLCGKRSRVRGGGGVAYYDWLSQKPKAIMDT